jgi:hypothetical protein
MNVYLLYYDTDYGSREEWNMFYTPCEVFDSDEKRQQRIAFIKQQVDEDGNMIPYEFHTVDTVIMTDQMIEEWDRD